MFPCRLADTRFDSQGGAFGGGSVRGFRAWPESIDLSSFGGSAIGCGIPGSATAIHVNFTIVDPVASGYLRAWQFDQPEPVATVFAWRPGFGMTNAVTIPLCSEATPELNCTYDFNVKIYLAPQEHLVIDVLGYYSGWE